MRVARYVDRLHGARVNAGVIHAGAHRGRRGVEVLHLLGHVAHVAHGLGKVHSFLHRRAGVARDQIRHHVLLEPVFTVQAFKFTAERVVDGAARLAHHTQHRVAHMLGRHA